MSIDYWNKLPQEVKNNVYTQLLDVKHENARLDDACLAFLAIKNIAKPMPDSVEFFRLPNNSREFKKLSRFANQEKRVDYALTLPIQKTCEIDSDIKKYYIRNPKQSYRYQKERTKQAISQLDPEHANAYLSNFRLTPRNSNDKLMLSRKFLLRILSDANVDFSNFMNFYSNLKKELGKTPIERKDFVDYYNPLSAKEYLEVCKNMIQVSKVPEEEEKFLKDKMARRLLKDYDLESAENFINRYNLLDVTGEVDDESSFEYGSQPTLDIPLNRSLKTELALKAIREASPERAENFINKADDEQKYFLHNALLRQVIANQPADKVEKYILKADFYDRPQLWSNFVSRLIDQNPEEALLYIKNAHLDDQLSLKSKCKRAIRKQEKLL